MSVRRTDASASGRWPTATRMDGNSSGAAGYSTESGRHAGTTLTDAAVRGWNTPRAAMASKGGNPDRKQPRGDLEAQARSWATPNASDSFVGEIRSSEDAKERQLHRGYDNGSKRTSTGSLAKDVATWPTPRSSPNENRTTKRAPTHGETHGRVLAGEAAGHHRPTTCPHGSECKPSLRPAFVEWLMGFPIGWTAFEPSATEWSRWLRRMRSELWRLESQATPKGAG